MANLSALLSCIYFRSHVSHSHWFQPICVAVTGERQGQWLCSHRHSSLRLPCHQTAVGAARLAPVFWMEFVRALRFWFWRWLGALSKCRHCSSAIAVGAGLVYHIQVFSSMLCFFAAISIQLKHLHK